MSLSGRLQCSLALLLWAAWLPVSALQSIPEFERTPSRVITLAPHLTELIYALDQQDRLVAVIEHSDDPDAARLKPRIGDAFRIDFERIVSLQPDLVIGWRSGNPESAMSRLEKLGIPVWRTEVDSPAAQSELILALGDALDAEPAARKLAVEWQQGLENLREKYAGRTPVRYLLQLNAQPIYTINDAHLISRLLAVCRGENIFGELGSLAPTVSEEAVVEADPEVILALDLPEGLERWRRWPQMDAVADGHLYAVPDSALARPVPAAMAALQDVCELLDRARGTSPNGQASP